MAIALLMLEHDEHQARANRANRDATTPPKWRKRHAALDKAAAAIQRWEGAGR